MKKEAQNRDRSGKMEGMEDRILEAAVACIEEYGVHRLTVRRIAAKAGVNTAAINYYFRTKEQLMDKVDELTIRMPSSGAICRTRRRLPPQAAASRHPGCIRRKAL
jgi:AcrR family transcriptional regulator